MDKRDFARFEFINAFRVGDCGCLILRKAVRFGSIACLYSKDSIDNYWNQNVFENGVFAYEIFWKYVFAKQPCWRIMLSSQNATSPEFVLTHWALDKIA